MSQYQQPNQQYQQQQQQQQQYQQTPQFQQAGGSTNLPPGYSDPALDPDSSDKGLGTKLLVGAAGVAALGVAGYALHNHHQSSQQQQMAMNNPIPPMSGGAPYPPPMSGGNPYPSPMSGGAYPPPTSGAPYPPPMSGPGGFGPGAMAGAAGMGMMAGAAMRPPMAGAPYPPPMAGPMAGPPPMGMPGAPMGMPGAPMAMPGAPMAGLPPGFMYSGMPAPYVPRHYSYPIPYSPMSPFMLPVGLPPQYANKMMQASTAFRMYDTNRSGHLSKKEFKRALKHLGMYMHKGQAKQIFYMVDRDRSGHISEREFCEWWVQAFPY